MRLGQRRREKAADRWQQWRWGWVAPLPISWPSCFPPGHSSLAPSALPFLGPRSDFLILALSCSPLTSCGAPSPLPSSLKGSAGDSFLSQMSSLSLTLPEPHGFPPSYSRGTSSSSCPVLSAAHVSSDAHQHSYFP